MMDTTIGRKAGGRAATMLALAAVGAIALATWAPAASASGYYCYEGSCYCWTGSSVQPCGNGKDFGAESNCNRLVGGYYLDSGAAGPVLRRVQWSPDVADYAPPYPEIHEGLPCPPTASETNEFCYQQHGYRPLATEVVDSVFTTPDHPVELVGYHSAPARRIACDAVPWMTATCWAPWYVDWEWRVHAGANCYVQGDPDAPVRNCGQSVSTEPSWWAYQAKCTDRVLQTG